MSLSVCCFAHRSPERVVALLALLRPAADEIVVALDERADDAMLPALADIADSVVRVPFLHPAERAAGWLHEQCSARWILRIDTDEIPSRDLIAALPELVSATDVTHYCLPRLWLFPDAGFVLDQPPWKPDYQLRLVRNDPALLRFPGELHSSVAPLGPRRYLDLPLYHADCLLNSVEERERKCRTYERMRPGLRIAGRPFNHAYYLPERYESLRTARVVERDRELVASVLDPTPLDASARKPRVRVAERDEVDRRWERRPLPESAYRAELSFVNDEERMTAGESREVFVRVKNLGDEHWGWGWESGIRVAYRWRDGDGGLVVPEGLRTPLPASVAPGGEAVVAAVVTAPAGPGRYVLELDLVHEHVRWFGSETRTEAVVEPPRRIAVLGASAHRRIGADAALGANLQGIADRLPEFEPLLFGDAPALVEARFGYAAAPSVSAYLLAGLASPITPRASLRLAARTRALVRAARRLRRGLPADGLPAAGREFLEALSSAELLLSVEPAPAESPRPLEEAWTRVATVLTADALAIPVIISGAFVGPSDRAAERILARRSFRRASLISVYDAHSAAALAGLGVPRERIVERWDDATAMEPAPDEEVEDVLASVGVPRASGFVLVALHDSPALASLAAVAETLDALRNRRGFAAIFAPVASEHEEDQRVAERLGGLLSDPSSFHLIEPLPEDDVLLALTARAHVTISSRYQLALFSATRGVPTVAVCDDGYAGECLARLADRFEGRVAAVHGKTDAAVLVAEVEHQLAMGKSAPVVPSEPLPIVEYAERRRAPLE